LKLHFKREKKNNKMGGEDICKDFRRNACFRDSCKFKHVESKSGEEDDEYDVCKDFKRNVCFRGNTCRFKHPGEDKNTKMKLTFCGNFQRGRCNLDHCQYVHAEKGVEVKYLRTGWLPDELRQTVVEHFGLCMRFIRGDCGESNCSWKHTNLMLDIPDDSLFTYYFIFKQSGVCKEFLEGRHQKEQYCPISMKHCSPEDIGLGGLNWQEVRTKMELCGGTFGGRKRARMDDGDMDMMAGMSGVSYQEFIMIQRENRQLRLENEQLKAKMGSCACRPACRCPPQEASGNIFW